MKKEFVIAIANISDAEANPHFKSQYTFLTDEDGKLIVDFIGKLENAEKDFLYVLDKLGRTDIEIPHFKTSLRGKYIDYYTPKTRNIVAKRYHKDIQLFEYDF